MLLAVRYRERVTQVYVTSDGGADLTDVFALAAELEGSHVSIVSADALVDLALQRERREVLV